MYAFLSGGTPEDPTLVIIEMTADEARSYLFSSTPREDLAQLIRSLIK